MKRIIARDRWIAVWCLLVMAGSTGTAIFGIVVAAGGLNDLIKVVLGISVIAVGALLMVPDLGAWSGQKPFVWLGERIGLKGSICLQLLASSGLTLGMAFAAEARNAWVLLALLFTNGFVLAVEGNARAYYTLFLAGHGVDEARRKARWEGQEGSFSAVSTAAWLILVPWPPLLGLTSGFIGVAAVMWVAAFIVMAHPSPPLVVPRASSIASKAASPQADPLVRRRLRRLHVAALLTGLTLGMLVTAQVSLVKAKGGSPWIPIAVGALAGLVGCFVMPRWSRLAGRRPLSSLLWACALFAIALVLLALPLALMNGSIWDGGFVVVYATGLIAGAFGVVTGFNMTRRAHHLDRIAHANAHFLFWRIPGVMIGRFITPIVVEWAEKLWPRGGAQVAIAFIGLVTLLVVIGLLRRWRISESEVVATRL